MVDMRGDWTFSELCEVIDNAMWDVRANHGYADEGLDDDNATPEGFHMEGFTLAEIIWKGLDGL